MGVIIGTAGHVDHGKTELIKALTGVDTDRLEEEKRRGLTIDLGFAPIDLPKSGRVGIIDVPGHIDYLKNMLAGVGGIDLALLVIAADEGVMPQTLEHLQILRLLKVPRLVVVVSKVDLVDGETRELVAEEVKDLLLGSYLADSPLVEVSPATGDGLDELSRTVDELVAGFPEKDLTQPPRLLVDRVFVLKGVGTVITGSLVSGTIKEGEELVVYPRRKRTRARQIQVFNEKRETAEAGNRVALNLVGLTKGEVMRGDVVSKEGILSPTRLLDARLEVLPEARRIKDWARVRLYLGSGEFLGRVALMERRQLDAGDEGFCQLRLEREVVALYGDRFVLRLYSPMELLGGGTILHATPEKHKRNDSAVLQAMKARAGTDLANMIVTELEFREVRDEELRASLNVKGEDWKIILGELTHKGEVIKAGAYLFGRHRWAELKERMVKRLQGFHSKYPLRSGMPKEELKRRLGLKDAVFGTALDAFEEIEIEGGTVRLRGREIRLTGQQLEQARRLEKVFLKARFSPPDRTQVLQDFDKEIFGSLLANGTLIKVTEDLFFHREAIEKAKKLIAQYVNENREIRLSDMRDILGSTRKYVVPLAEYFDTIRFTKRSGDLRTLANT